MNRWIEDRNFLYNLDKYYSCELNGETIFLLQTKKEWDTIDFDSKEKAAEFYEKIKAKLNLKEWE